MWGKWDFWDNNQRLTGGKDSIIRELAIIFVISIILTIVWEIVISNI